MNIFFGPFKGLVQDIEGIKTNLPFHQVVLDNEFFVKGDYTTHFIKERNILDDVKQYLEGIKPE